MAFLGLISIILSFYAVFSASFTGRKKYLYILFWTIPVIGMSYINDNKTDINGIVVLISFVMAFLTVFSLFNTALWYVPPKNKAKIRHIAVFLLNCVIFNYYFYQCIANGYIVYFAENFLHKNAFAVALVLGIFCAWISVSVIFTSFDRYFSQSQKFIIIKCSPVRKNGIIRIRGIKGVQNGVEYFFNADRRAFFLLRNEKRIATDVKKGVLGGMYVSPNVLFKESGRRKKRITKRLIKRSVVIVLFVLLILLLVLRINMNMDFGSVIIEVLKIITGLKR